MNKYPLSVLIVFADALNGNKKALAWLMKYNFPEIAAFINAIHGNIDGLNWLDKHKFVYWSSFYNALIDNNHAYIWLAKHRFKVSCMMVLMVKKNNPKAQLWLKQHKNPVFYEIATVLKKLFDEYNKDNDDTMKFFKFFQPFS